jgi:hypothetical protein
MNDIYNKVLKYILISLVTYLSLSFVPSNEIKNKESLMITFIVAISYAILDRILPSIQFNSDKDSEEKN